MLTKDFSVGGAAINTTPLHWQNNLDHILKAIHRAQLQQVNVLCLPELCITGYGCEDMFDAEWVTDKALQILFTHIVPATKGIAVAVGLPLRYEGRTYNAAALVEDGSLIGFYAKQFLAHNGVYYEPRWFAAWPAIQVGSIAYNGQHYPIQAKPFTLASGISVGFEICEDAWHDKERPAYNFSKSVDVVLNPSASHFEFGKTAIRRQLVLEGSKHAKCFYVYANILGNESGRLIFDGEVLIANQGELLSCNRYFSFEDVNLISADLSTKAIAEDALMLSKEESLQKAIALGLFDYMRKSFSKGFVLSLSGGADSAACAVLVSEMAKLGVKELGLKVFLQKAGLPEHLTEPEIMPYLLACAYQSTENSSDITKHAAEAVARNVGAAYYYWSVNEVVELNKSIFSEATGHKLNWSEDDLLLQNIQSRSRAPLIWMLANKRKALLITTGNRSEASVGYCTMDGDTSGGIAPIAGIDKHYLRQWLIWAESTLNYPALSYINKQAPTAELRPLASGQTDEADLMPYALLQQIEELAIYKKLSPQVIAERLAESTDYDKAFITQAVAKFFSMWAANQWKRERTAVSFHIDTYSVDSRGWCRFPVLSGKIE
jgi:NAD+ synthase (glutamine-hydrolysing)